MNATLDEIWVITCWVMKKKERDTAIALCLVMTLLLISFWTILMSSQDITLLLCPVISSRGDLVSVSFKHIYYFQCLIFEIIRFVLGFYVLDVTFPRLLISSFLLRKFVFQNYWSFCSAEFALLLLFSEFLKTALFVIYSSRSMSFLFQVFFNSSTCCSVAAPSYASICYNFVY